jgi:hypothetical protein
MELGFTVPASVTHLQAARVNVPFTPISRSVAPSVNDGPSRRFPDARATESTASLRALDEADQAFGQLASITSIPPA